MRCRSPFRGSRSATRALLLAAACMGCGRAAPEPMVEAESAPSVAALVATSADGDSELDAALSQTYFVDTDTKPATPEASLSADLDEALKLLEAKKFAEFIERFAPAEDLRRIRQADAMDQAARMFTQNAGAAEKLRDLLTELKKQKPAFDKSGGLATFEFDPGEKLAAGGPAVKVPSASGVKVAAGYGGDLPAVLAGCIKTLEAGDVDAFVQKMYPVTEAARLREDEAKAAFAAKMKELPQLAQRMIADLKELQKRKPEMAEGGKVAVYQLKGESGARTIRFQKLGDDWRLYDGTPRIYQEVAAAAKAKPKGGTMKVQMERLGNGWRFIEFKL